LQRDYASLRLQKGGFGFKSLLFIGMIGTLVGYGALLIVAGLRLWVFGKVRPTREWCFALAGCALLHCCQLLPYELPMLCLAVPYLVGLIGSGRTRDRLAAVLIATPAAFAFLDGGDGSPYYQLLARTVGNTWLETVLQSHRCLGVLLTTAGVLVVGPRAAHSAASGSVSLTSFGRLFSPTSTTVG